MRADPARLRSTSVTYGGGGSSSSSSSKRRRRSKVSVPIRVIPSVGFEYQRSHKAQIVTVLLLLLLLYCIDEDTTPLLF